MRLSVCFWCVLLIGISHPAVAQQATSARQEPKIDQPLSAGERSATVRLTRLRSTRLWWNDENRVTGISCKGDDASDHALSLAGQLPGLRTVVLVPTPHSQLTDHGLAPLAALPDLELLSISGSRTNDAAMQSIGQMHKLRTLVLNCKITDAGLEALAELKDIEQLDLTQSRISDAGVFHLKNFPKLRVLALNGTQLTNQALETIAEVKTLERLYLGNTLIDDGAVETLKKMEQLQLLFLRDTRITTSAIAELQPAFLESCTIIHQSGTCQGTRKSPLAMAHVSNGTASASAVN